MATILSNKSGLRVLISGSILNLLLGILYVWSVFVRPVSEIYGWDIESVKLTSSFMLSFFVVGILIGGKLQLKAGTQKIVLLGGLMLSGGMLLTAILPENYAPFMYITYGIIGGFGVGAAYNAIITASQKWFPKNRGLATGISVCAFGFATVIFAPLIETLIKIEQIGLRGTFLILAGIFLLFVLILFRFIRLPDIDAMATSSDSAAFTKKQYTTSEAIKTKEFYLITLSLMFATATFFILNPSFKILALERGIDDHIATLIVMLTGVANALGRLGTPLLSDKIGREKTAIINIYATALCALFLCFANGFLFIFAIAVIAYCFGGCPGLYPVMVADYFGIKNVGSNYGAVMIGFAVSALTFPIVIGLINNISVKFIVLSILAAIGAILIIILLKSHKKGEIK